MKNKILLCFTLLAVLACGMPAVNMESHINTSPTVVSTVVAPVVGSAPVPTRTMYVVCGVDNTEGGLWVRKAAGMQSPAINLLSNGDVVTLTGEEVKIDSSVWVQIEGGWINSRYTCMAVQ